MKAEKTKNSVFMKRLIRDINTNKNKVEQAIEKMNGLPESGGRGITGAIVVLKSFLEPLHKLLDSSDAVLKGEKFEEMNGVRTAYENSFIAGEPLQRRDGDL